jgi:hypothetical protein
MKITDAYSKNHLLQAYMKQNLLESNYGQQKGQNKERQTWTKYYAKN